MLASGIPVKFPKVFAEAAGGSYTHQVPENSQIGITDGAASFETGFPPLCFTPRNSGGVPPQGIDFNGILQMITAWSQWFQAGGATPYDGTFQTAIGGYPKGARVASAVTDGLVWISTVDSNLTNPDASGAGWTQYSEIAAYVNSSSAGSVKIPGTPFYLKWKTFTTSIPGIASDIFSGGYSAHDTGFTWNAAFPNACYGAWACYNLVANGNCTFGLVEATAAGFGVWTNTAQNLRATNGVVFGFGT